MKKRSVRLRILKVYRSDYGNFAPGEIVSASQNLADELILAEAEYPAEQIDIEIERITAAHPEAVARMIAFADSELAAGRCQSMDTPFEKQDPKSAGLKIGDKIRAIRDFYVEPFFDDGWEVKEGMIGIIYATDLGDGEIAIDFGEALDSHKRKGVVVLVVPQDAIELVS